MGWSVNRKAYFAKKYLSYRWETVKQFNITSLLPITSHTNDGDLKDDMKSVNENEVALFLTTMITGVLRNHIQYRPINKTRKQYKWKLQDD